MEAALGARDVTMVICMKMRRSTRRKVTNNSMWFYMMADGVERGARELGTCPYFSSSCHHTLEVWLGPAYEAFETYVRSGC